MNKHMAIMKTIPSFIMSHFIEEKINGHIVISVFNFIIYHGNKIKDGT